MTTARRTIPITLDTLTCTQRIGTSFKPLALPNLSDGISLNFGTQNIFQATLCNGATNVPFLPVAGAGWLWGLDNRPFQTPPNYANASSDDSEFNLAEDWDKLDVDNGLICWRAALTGASLKAALIASSDPATMYCNLWMIPDGEYVLIGAWPVRIYEIYIDPEEV